ncbi:hypothetical protein [Phaeodactylibacter sp.]|uniref:hypothetical protein n=1 Tax=Phaeodactylibacter sp. TaxID=1940289 RepID=UPI0025DF3CBB|nr:hypothetical protein [Phaeodactylibacter sp.]MCI5093461.1 hypothetical protein [Phaeodactylibacter sp.]
MKKSIPTLLVCIITFCIPTPNLLIGQTTTRLENKPNRNYETWVHPINKAEITKGYLNEVEDSLIVISNLSGQGKRKIYFNEIQNIQFRQKGQIGRGFISGALTGFVIGGLAGLVQGDDRSGFLRFSAEEKAVFYGGLFAIPGGLLGALIGSAKTTIPISGRSKGQKRKLSQYKLAY